VPSPARGPGRSSGSRGPTGPGRGRTSRRPGSTRSGGARQSQDTRREPERRSRLTGRSALLFVVLAVLVVSYASSARAWLDQREHINDLEEQIAADERRVEELTEEKQRWDDPAYVEAQARERFGWVMPGEVGYRVIGEDGEPLGDSTGLGEPAGSDGEGGTAWWDTAWGSVQAAGEDTPEEGDRPARFIGPKGQIR
jgi:cell division protein FtsB